MAQLNEFVQSNRKSTGITLPSSFVRPVSLERIRGMSSSREHSSTKETEKQTISNAPLSNRSYQQQSSVKNYCQKLLDKKLFGASSKNPISSVTSSIRSDQLYKQHGKRQEKRVQKLKQVEDNKLKQCTFKPKTLVDKSQKRTFQEFLQSQNNHCRKTANKVDMIRKQLDQKKVNQATFKPKINSIQNQNGQNKQNIYTRLYELSKPKHTKQNQSQCALSSRQQSKRKTQKISQSPKQNKVAPISRIPSSSRINPLSRKSSCSNIPRNPSVKSIDKIKQNMSTTSSQPNHQIVSINTQKQLIKKVIRQMCNACQILSIFDRMSYLQLSNLMTQMRFINQQTVDRRTLYTLWSMLEGDTYQYIYTHNLCKIICSIMGLHNHQMIEKQIQASQQPILEKPNYFDHDSQIDSSQTRSLMKQGVIYLNQKSSKQLKKQLESLYINRLNTETSKQVVVQQHSYKPIISEVSKQLAQKKRNKVLQQTIEMLKNNQIQYQIEQSGEISHADYLILQKKAQQYKLHKIIEQKQATKEQELQSLIRQKTSSSNANSQRYLDLYAMGSLTKERRDRTSDEIQLQKYHKQMTFKPNMTKASNDKFQPVAKDIDKAIYRMYQGRKMREKQQSIEVPKKTPLLYLNINIDNKQTQRLQIFQDDDPHELAFRFGNKFGLNPQAKKRLSELILSQLKDLV